MLIAFAVHNNRSTFALPNAYGFILEDTFSAVFSAGCGLQAVMPAMTLKLLRKKQKSLER